MHHSRLLYRSTYFLFLLLLTAPPVFGQGQLTFEDVIRFEELDNPVISGNGDWIAFDVWPERGDGEARVKHLSEGTVHAIERGERPVLSRNGQWVGSIVKPPFIEAENADNDAPDPSLVLLNTASGEKEFFNGVRDFEFSNNNRWLLIYHTRPEELDDHAEKNSYLGSPVTIRDLSSEETAYIDFVNDSAIDSSSSYFIYGVVDTTGEENGLYAIDFQEGDITPGKIRGTKNAYFSNLTWDDERGRIAFTATELDSANKYTPQDAAVIAWQVFDDDPEVLISPEDAEAGYRLRANNALSWSDDGERLFYGLMLDEMVRIEEEKPVRDSLTADNLYDLDYILEEVESDVWHWNDPLVKTNEIQTWNSRKNRLYRAVYHIEEELSVQLGDQELPDITINDNPDVVLGSSNIPYKKLRTWDGSYNDFFLVDLDTGERIQVIEKSRFNAQLSPDGNYVAWFEDGHWHLYDVAEGSRRNLTETLDVPFYNEDNDRPMPSPGYGIAGWVEGDQAVLIYDKYDVWQFDTSSNDIVNLTGSQGREEQRIFRIIDLNPDEERFETQENLLLSMYHDHNKNYGFYRGRIGMTGVSLLLEDDVRYNYLAKAEDSEQILFTTERYDKFPNLWISRDNRFQHIEQITNLHDDLTEKYVWGHAELIDWYNNDGRKVQGVLIYPGDYEEGKRYPVMIYYYERYSQRLHQFDHIYTNHRPVLAQYASDGYAVFLPDIWFDVPVPGYSATKNLVPGVQKLIEMGVADPEAIGLHGHSWSGYLTAHVITQTDIFAAAVAGAPVSNMTSAYSGIRWGTGLARQFQYEQTQSRLGVSMWENLGPFIENSPVFYADRINTPLLLQFGDADEAVPWYQGIELYLALRRLGKDSVFLQYHDEPHHLQKYANRLDYAIKMKEYFDHYLKGKEAPSWITDGVPHRGD